VQSPETRYVQRGEVNIAYQVVGERGPDLIIVPGFISHLDLQWMDPGYSRFLERLASFTRLILYDKPGTGLSDPIPNVPTLEERIADIKAVLDAVGVERTALLGFSEGGPVCALFASTWPDRTSALILYGTYARGRPSEEELLAAGATLEEYQRVASGFEDVVDHWGEGRLGRLIAPSAQGELQRRFWGVFERAGASPTMARALIEASMRADVTPILPTIQAATLVLHRNREIFPIASGRQLARLIPGARLVELDGEDHAFWVGDVEPVLAELEEFLTGMRTPEPQHRLLATILFTDIVGSTQRAGELGDRRWHELVDEHNARVRELLARFDGVSSTPQATDSLPASRAREWLSGERARSSGRCVTSASRFEPACTRESVSGSATSWVAWGSRRRTDRGNRKWGRSSRLQNCAGSRRRLGPEVHRSRDASSAWHRRALAALRR